MKHIVQHMSILVVLLILSPLCAQCLARVHPDMTIEVRVDPSRAPAIKGRATTTVSVVRRLKLEAGSFHLQKAETEKGEQLDFSVQNGLISLGLQGLDPSQQIVLHFSSPGKAHGRKGAPFSSQDYVLATGPWCPLLSGPALYRVEVTVGNGYTAISEADRIIFPTSGSERNFVFEFDHPRQAITLAVARFFNYSAQIRGVTFSVHLLSQSPDLAGKLLQALEGSLEFYERLIGPFPFQRFQVIETPAPLGVTVPTITLIGSQIIDKPFLREISLAHEFVHSWFGNSVWVDEKDGNWCEGLTTYLADAMTAERKGTGSLYRHDILSDYKAYVHQSVAFPLSSFRYRYDRTSKAVGYGKGAMVFHMLRRSLGDEDFFEAVSKLAASFRFKSASWKDIGEIFSEVAKRDLSPFFSQWLHRKDVPRLEISDCIYEENEEGGFETRCTLRQMNDSPYLLDLPVRVLCPSGSKDFTIAVGQAEEPLRLETVCRPVLVLVDPEYDVMRDLDRDEFPASLARLFGAERRYLVLPAKEEKEVYTPAVSFFEKKGFEAVEREKLKHAMLKKGAFVVLGSTKGRLETFAGSLDTPRSAMAVEVRINPLDSRFVVAAIKAADRKQVEKAMGKLPHYGKYAFLEFKEGRLSKKKRAAFERGIGARTQPALSGIFAKEIDSASRITAGLEPYQIVYLGEKHDQQGIHQAQLELIKRLSKSGPLAVGMEMFQRPFQSVIDRYLAGQIDERQFLRQTEYFKRWAFNYHFYRPIVEFCKENGIPIIALNLPTEISKKIARTGLASLNEKELRQLPQRLDLTNELYERHLKKIYSAHRSGQLQDFQNFFEAQVAWDETMASSIAEYVTEHPDRRFVVIVGGGHVEYGYGIPSRVKRMMPTVSQAVALFNEPALSDPSKADLFLHAPEMEEPFTARLGVVLTGKDKLTIERVVPGSPASKAGFKKGDRIDKVDGISVKDIYDLKVELFFKKRGDRLKIQVTRKGPDGNHRSVELLTGRLEPFTWKRSASRFHSKNNGSKERK